MKSFLDNLSKRTHTANRLNFMMVATSLLFLAIGCVGAWRVHQLHARSEELLSRNVVGIRAAVELETHFQELRHSVDRYLWTADAFDSEQSRDVNLRAIHSRKANIEHWLREAEQAAATAEEEVLLARIEAGLESFYTAIRRLERLDASSQAAKDDLSREIETILDARVLAAAREFLSIDEALLEASREDAERRSRRLVWTLLGVSAFGAVAALISGFALARAISRSLIQVRIPMLDVAGKLSEVAGDVVVSTKLDLSDLGPALERLSAEVQSVVDQLQVRHREMLHAEQLATAGQLAAGIAHEIRNPLMSMKMLVQSARRPDDEIRRLEVLLDEFLDFARPRPLRKAIVDVRPIAESIVSFVQRQADARNVFLECEIPPEPILLDIDSARIRQVMLNLLLNGIQITPAGGSVRLKVDQGEVRGCLACQLRVSDDGPGLGGVTEQRLFEPFFSTKETGLGLGLPVSQRIVKEHGGEILLGPDRSGGAVFIVVLPIPGADRSRAFAKLDMA
jgi:two-component system sensor histidine kinase HydH